MAFSFLLVLVVLMATGSGSRRGAEKSKYSKRSWDDVSTSSESEDSSENEAEWVIGKGKAPMPSRKPKDRKYYPKRISGGPVIREGSQSGRRASYGEGQPQITAQRRRIFQNRACLGERNINFSDLCREVPEFEWLLKRIPLGALGRVPAKKGFCSELIREFYMMGGESVEDHVTGRIKFETSVRGVKLLISPELIGAYLGLPVDKAGVHYTWGDFVCDTHWDVVINAICKTGTETNRDYIESKDLKPEFQILSLILCYNLMPTVATKRIRWDRLLLLYFLGHPERAAGVCVNIPTLMWENMANVIEAKDRHSVLPYPIFITSLLEDHGVDVTCDNYEYGLGSIDRITMANSIGTLRTFGQVKGHASDATPSAPPRTVQDQASTGSEEGVTVLSLHREVQGVQKYMEQRFKKVEDGLQKLFEIIGYKHDDVVPGVTGTGTSHGHTSDDDDDEDKHDDLRPGTPPCSCFSFRFSLLFLNRLGYIISQSNSPWRKIVVQSD